MILSSAGNGIDQMRKTKAPELFCVFLPMLIITAKQDVIKTALRWYGFMSLKKKKKSNSVFS